MKMQDLDGVQLNLYADLGVLRSDVNTKETIVRVSDLELQLLAFSTKTELNKVYKTLDAYTSLDSFNKRMIKQEAIYNDLAET